MTTEKKMTPTEIAVSVNHLKTLAADIVRAADECLTTAKKSGKIMTPDTTRLMRRIQARLNTGRTWAFKSIQTLDPGSKVEKAAAEVPEGLEFKE